VLARNSKTKIEKGAETFMNFLFGIAAGWFFCRLLTRPSASHIKYDYILAWDKDVLAWRPVSRIEEDRKNETYLAAVAVEPASNDA
jgi:hypothetical protein